MSAYYNEHDPFAAAWLRSLIAAGHIAPGEVDERSILEVRPADLRGFTQCHFFAGIGVWSYALRLAGWDDARPIWTGSCPCQPFSAAGQGKSYADERHLSPVWLRLIEECRPSVVFGEQVGAAVGMGWLDALFISLEQADYACGAAVFPACSVGAPHIRSRLYFVADDDIGRRGERGATRLLGDSERGGSAAGVAGPQPREEGGAGVPNNAGREGAGPGRRPADCWSDAIWLPCRDGKLRPTGRGIHPLVVGNAASIRHGGGPKDRPRLAAEVFGARCEIAGVVGNAARGGQRIERDAALAGSRGHPDGADAAGVVADAERDGGRADESGREAQGRAADGRDSATDHDRHRPTEPGALALADGPSAGVGHLRGPGAPEDQSAEAIQNTAEARVMRLRGYGNAIAAPQAEAFIRAFLEIA